MRFFHFFWQGFGLNDAVIIKIPSGGERLVFITGFMKICVPVAGNLNGSLMFAIIQVLLIWSAALILYRKKIIDKTLKTNVE